MLSQGKKPEVTEFILFENTEGYTSIYGPQPKDIPYILWLQLIYDGILAIKNVHLFSFSLFFLIFKIVYDLVEMGGKREESLLGSPIACLLFFLTKHKNVVFPIPSLKKPIFSLCVCSVFLKSSWHYAIVLILIQKPRKHSSLSESFRWTAMK